MSNWIKSVVLKSVVLKSVIVLQAVFLLTGCAWQAAVIQPDGSPFLVDKTVLENLGDFGVEAD
ncbi:MAG: hypothetical protein U9R15_10465, partial [Chloroflexota bacterium]|nr:hypothetical protein [Chloroflexota bacterium]